MLVHEDADLEAAVDGALFGIFFNTGQVCNASSRLLLHEPIADEFLSLFLERAGRLRVGKPTSEDTQIGPLISREQLERVVSYVELGREEGAELILGENVSSKTSRLAISSDQPSSIVSTSR